MGVILTGINPYTTNFKFLEKKFGRKLLALPRGRPKKREE